MNRPCRGTRLKFLEFLDSFSPHAIGERRWDKNRSTDFGAQFRDLVRRVAEPRELFPERFFSAAAILCRAQRGRGFHSYRQSAWESPASMQRLVRPGCDVYRERLLRDGRGRIQEW